TVDMDDSVDAASALKFEVASGKADNIEWMSGRDFLLVGTSSSIFALVPSGNAAISAVNIPLINRISSLGVSEAQALTTESSIVFINRPRTKVVEAQYTFERNSLITNNLNRINDHLADSRFKKVIKLDEPDHLIYVLRDDGTILCMSYIP